MTNRFEEFADKRGLVITGCTASFGAKFNELVVEYTKFLDGRVPTDTPHLNVTAAELAKDFVAFSRFVEARSFDLVSEELPVVTELVYTFTYVPTR